MEDMSGYVPSFSKGLSILLVDNVKTSLMYLSTMLQQFSYKVTTSEAATKALSMVEEQKGRFKLVIANVNLPDMDILQFLHLILDKDIPVILVSSESNISAGRKAIEEGASFYLSGPNICVDDLKYLWQHAYRTKRSNTRSANSSDNKSQSEGKYRGDFGLMKMDNIHVIENNIRQLMTVNNNNVIQKQNGSKTKRPMNEDQVQQGQMMMNKDKKVKMMHPQQANIVISSNSNGKSKKSRIVWTPELHLRFTAAISQLGDKKARPKPILEIMNVPHLTARQVASHLQKYRSQVQRICETGITNLPAVSRSSNFYGWTRNVQTIHHNTSQQYYQPTPPPNYGNLIEILKATSDNYTPPIVTCETSKNNNQQVSVFQTNYPSCGEGQQNVMEISNNDNSSGGDDGDDDCFDEWMNEVLNPIHDPVEMPNMENIMNTSYSYEEQVFNNTNLQVHEDDHSITNQPNPNDVARYCNWLADELLSNN